MRQPLVSVICLSYNHENFVREAIESVLHQSYPNIELIVVDDASTDGTVSILTGLKDKNPAIKSLLLKKNVGNCRAFNQGLSMATGEFIIDFATDDVMLPEKIQHQVEFFLTLDNAHGVVFTDAIYINDEGKILHQHYQYLLGKGLIKNIPQGDVYQSVLTTYFIAAPTMMVRSSVFEALNGYDEQLSYEDFDFWVRSSRTFKYAYLEEVTTKIRKTKRSMSRTSYKKGDRQLHSTYLVLKKALTLNHSPEEDKALAKRLRYEIRQAVFSENYQEAKLFHKLLHEIGYKNIISDALIVINELRLPLSVFRNLYHRMRFN